LRPRGVVQCNPRREAVACELRVHRTAQVLCVVVRTEEHATLPGLAEDHVEAVHAPDREEVRGVAAADEDDVVRECELAHAGGRPRIEGERRQRRAVELGQLVRLRARRRVEEHVRAAGEAEEMSRHGAVRVASEPQDLPGGHGTSMTRSAAL
jgi:hypothetical protein